MKTAKLLLTVMVGVMLLGGVALAEEDAPSRRQRRRSAARRAGDRRQHRHACGEFRKNTFERMVKNLDLTAEQQKQIEQIRDTHEKAQRALREAMRKQIEAVLTDEQKAKAKKMMRHGRRAVIGARMVRRALGQVDLTDRQEKQVKKIVDETRKSACEAESAKEKNELWRKAIKTIKSDVLTKEQAEKFEEAMQRMGRHHRHRRLLAHLDLTDEQKAQGKKIREKYQDKIEDAEPEERRELIKKMHEELESILTDEQKAKAKKFREGWEDRKERRRGRRGETQPRRRRRQ